MLLDNLFILSQYLAPQHTLSRSIGMLADSKNPVLKNTFINWFIQRYNVNMDEAEREQASEYSCFNDFFTRTLKDGVRPILANDQQLACPVDGAISQLGNIQNGKIFQAKGQDFSLLELLGGSEERAAPFVGGKFSTIYLSPKDYHRIHMPITGTLKEMIYIPGKLFSVNPLTAEKVPGLFARNERVVAIFDTEIGPMAMVLVGAMIVASVETVWAGQVAPVRREIKVTEYDHQQPITIEKGAELGRFKLGSTVVMTFPADTLEWNTDLMAGSSVRMGQVFADTQQKA